MRDKLNFLQQYTSEILNDRDGFLDEFFTVIENLIEGREVSFHPFNTFQKSDLVFELMKLDERIREVGPSILWEENTEIDLEKAKIVAKTAFDALTSDKDYSIKLANFYVLSTLFYSALVENTPEEVITMTFPVKVAESLKPYVVAKKLEMEFSQEDFSYAIKSLSTTEPIDRKLIPPYAEKTSYIQKEGKYYLVYDILRGNHDNS